MLNRNETLHQVICENTSPSAAENTFGISDSDILLETKGLSVNFTMKKGMPWQLSLIHI